MSAPASTTVWTTAFLDLPASRVAAEVAFWAAVTDTTLSPWREETFATLMPAHGDAHLRVQRIGEVPARVHLDLHAEDHLAAAAHAAGMGARPVASYDGVEVLASPGGMAFCCVGAHERVRPPVTRWGSRLDQVCLDVDAADWDLEQVFWQAFTGWEPRASAVSTDFVSLARPDDQPHRLLLQRRRTADGPVTAHLDLAVADREAETARHAALGAEVEGVFSHWTLLRDPAGLAYCLTDRDPESGLLTSS